MSVIYTIVVVAICILLVLVVLIQNPKGGGIASGFSAANQIIGVKQSTDVVEKITWYLAIGLVVLCLFSGFFLSNTTTVEDDSIETQVDLDQLPSGLDVPLP
jgi:preprotein translocase subunit SecG